MKPHILMPRAPAVNPNLSYACRHDEGISGGIGVLSHRRPAPGHPGAGRGGAGGAGLPDTAGGDRLGQDLHRRPRGAGVAAPGHRHGPQQDPGRPALRGVQGVLPQQPGGVFRLLLRLLPAGGLCAVLRHLHREGRVGQRAHRADAAVGHQGAAGAPGGHHRGRHGVRHLRPRRPGVLPTQDGHAPGAGRADRPARHPAPVGRASVRAQRPRLPPGHLPGAGRRHRRLPGGVRAGGGAHRAVRRRDREHQPVRPADRRSAVERSLPASPYTPRATT